MHSVISLQKIPSIKSPCFLLMVERREKSDLLLAPLRGPWWHTLEMGEVEYGWLWILCTIHEGDNSSEVRSDNWFHQLYTQSWNSKVKHDDNMFRFVRILLFIWQPWDVSTFCLSIWDSQWRVSMRHNIALYLILECTIHWSPDFRLEDVQHHWMSTNTNQVFVCGCNASASIIISNYFTH